MTNETSLTEKIKRLEGSYGVKKLHNIGDSHGFIIPAWWLKTYGYPIDGNYYVNFLIQENQVIVSPIDYKDLKDIKVRSKGERP